MSGASKKFGKTERAVFALSTEIMSIMRIVSVEMEWLMGVVEETQLQLVE